jgi:hypothetical protein
MARQKEFRINLYLPEAGDLGRRSSVRLANAPATIWIFPILLTWAYSCVTGKTGRWAFMKSPPEVILPPSLLGEHTGDVLQKFGFSREEIQHLYTEKIVS